MDTYKTLYLMRHPLTALQHNLIPISIGGSVPKDVSVVLLSDALAEPCHLTGSVFALRSSSDFSEKQTAIPEVSEDELLYMIFESESAVVL